MKFDTPSRPFLRFLPAPHPATPQVVLLVASLLYVTSIFLRFDVVNCWLQWSFASEGNSPWRIYLTRPDCNYPPFLLYGLTLQEAIRRAAGWGEGHGYLLFLIKVPQILAHIAGGVLAYFGLRRLFGEKYARQVCLVYAVSAALFVNAALWGQVDSLLALVMVATVLLLMNNKPVPAGIVFGLSLTIKLQAIIIAPVVLLYAVRRFGWQQSAKAFGAGILTIAVIALPFVLGGAGSPLLKSYFGSAGYYPLRTLNAFNLWGFTYCVSRAVFHIPHEALQRDDTLIGGILSAKHIGLLLFASSLGVILYRLYRHPTPRMLAWTAALSAFSFFVLCTQMHERYGVPAAALFALVAPESLFALLICFGINLCAGWNQWLVLLDNWKIDHPLSPNMEAQWKTFDPSFLWLSFLNCLLFLASMGYALRPVRSLPEATTYPPSEA